LKKRPSGDTLDTTFLGTNKGYNRSMVKNRYGKLVRDKIPELIRKNEKTANIRHMDEHEFRRELLYLLIDSAEQLLRTGYSPVDKEFIESLADVQEVFDEILKTFNINKDTLAKVRTITAKAYGTFEQRIFLESVIDNKSGIKRE